LAAFGRISGAGMAVSTPDHKFVDNVSAVLAGLILVTVVITVLAITIANRTARIGMQDSTSQARLVERIKPFGDVVITGQETTLYGRNAVESIELASAKPVEDSGATAVASFDSGEAVYESACTACHGLGVAGAPKSGDAGAWAARIAQGMEVLYAHAIEGYQGAAGIMPAKGGRVDLSDEQVNWAVDYMVEQSQ
jgi:cytochrome c5